ncbi:unnamed protein product [Adineta ricciae]|uniref:G-protein coupled receptors family 1 profile domain-containing protein n=1 Tax=Adineta ricciae TaxID=249248 RepID=A0A814TAN0_ADIRI|nr:unnamed protein product [Adineta ricciae]CAF1158247.1 unnamed protein product [Adineta ricciae]
MSTMATLVLIQQMITRYALPIILTLGNIGNLFTIAIYSQKKQRGHSCAIYLIAISCFSLIGSNWAIVPTVYALDHFDLVSNSLVLCRIRGYMIHTCSMSFRYTLILFCADRYAFCSRRVFIRALSRPQIARRSVGILILVWCILSIHLLIFESIENRRCGVYGIYGQIFGYYVAICTGLIPIMSMTCFGLLLRRNLNQLHLQIQPLSGLNRLNRRDISFVQLALTEIIVYMICTVMYPAVTIYSQATSSMNSSKSAEQKQIESFINFLAMSLLLYLNYNTTFYVHLIISKAFRRRFRDFIMTLIRKVTNQTEVYQQNSVVITSNVRQQQKKSS